MSQLWKNGEPTPLCVEMFTQGDCWLLAIHLHRQTGWPIYNVGDDMHWVVRIPGRDRYLDVTGVHTRYMTLNTWGEFKLRIMGDMMLGYADQDVVDECAAIFEGSHRRASEIARRLLKKYKDQL